MAKVSKFVFWAPRILSILFLLFLSIFSFDVFDSCNGFLNCAGWLIMHNIPVFILAILLWVSWKHELVGAIAFILAGLLYIISVMMKSPFQGYYLSWLLIIAGPAFLIGILFFISWKQKKKSGKRKH